MNQQLSSYFEVLDPLDIRLKGSRVGIDNVLYYYVRGCSLTAIQEAYPSLTLEQIAATILYYHQNQPEIDQYLRDLEAWQEESARQMNAAAESSPVIQRIRAALAQR